MNYALALRLRPILRHAAQQLTLLGRATDLKNFSTVWLGAEDVYARLGALDLLELAAVVRHFELGLSIVRIELSDDWEEVESVEDRWLAAVRLNAVRLMLRSLRTWKRENGWTEIGFE